MFRGSPGLSADQLADIGSVMGGNFNADTRQTVTQYLYTVPTSDLDLALHIEAVRMRGVHDSKKDWQHERGAIEQEVAQDLSSPDYVFYSRLLAAMFKGTPYAHDALGTRPSFNQTTGAMLGKFHDTWYAPNNAILIVVGDIDPQKTLADVKNLFGGIPSKPVPQQPNMHFGPVKAESLSLKTDLPYGVAVVSFRMPGSSSPDYAAAEVLGDVLDSQRGSLYALVPEGKALYAGFSVNSLPKASLGYAVAAFPKGGSGEMLLKQVREIVAGVVKKGVPADLVRAAKLHELADSELQKNSVSGLAMAWSDALAVQGRKSPEDNVEAIQKVTVDDVNRVAKEYLNPQHAILAILTPQPSGEPVSSHSFGGRESLAPKQTKAVKLPGWAARAVSRLTIAKSTTHPTVTTLPSGLKLIVQPESISKTVSVYGHVKNNPDLETPKGKEGASEVLGQLFSYGTTSLNRVAFQRALDDIGANESAGTDFSLQVLSSHFDRGVELLADNQLHPALPDKALRITRQQVAGAVAGRLQSPGYLTERAIDSALFPKHDPTLRHATPASVSALELEDVKNYYHHVFRPDLTTIVVIGQVTPDEARRVIEKYFGAWRATGPKPSTNLPPVPPNKPSIVAVPDSSRVQDQVTLAETLGLNRFNPDYYALQLGNKVLGGGFYATRLYQDLRENTGLVYYVGSSFDVGKTRGIYSVDYACDPPNVSKARAIIVRDLRDMQSAPVSAQELQQAKALLLREIPLAESSIGYIARGMIARTDLGLPLDEPTLAAHHYMSLSADQVKAAFAKYLHTADLAQVSEGPAPH